mmetsp:Transcript_30661/g.49195  ORF Transcript_30661/g.49195 Transcript_30661/m.49195 type:complete len:114 (-) Transcript_30661:638-979(-)
METLVPSQPATQAKLHFESEHDKSQAAEMARQDTGMGMLAGTEASESSEDSENSEASVEQRSSCDKLQVRGLPAAVSELQLLLVQSTTKASASPSSVKVPRLSLLTMEEKSTA